MHNSAQTTGGLGAALSNQRYDGPVDTPRSMSPIESELQEMDRALLALNDEIGALTDRLTGVLRSEATSAQGVGQPMPPEPIRAPITGGLRDFNRRLANSIQRVRDLAARADL